MTKRTSSTPCCTRYAQYNTPLLYYSFPPGSRPRYQLTHNVHGPHDEKFYKFLSELEDEYEALKRSGYAGEGFHSKGHRVGENVSHNVPPHIARARALEAAEKRRRLGGMLGGSRRLGGSVVRRDLSPRELAAQVRYIPLSILYKS